MIFGFWDSKEHGQKGPHVGEDWEDRLSRVLALKPGVASEREREKAL